jgi:hypothetical protein
MYGRWTRIKKEQGGGRGCDEVLTVLYFLGGRLGDRVRERRGGDWLLSNLTSVSRPPPLQPWSKWGRNALQVATVALMRYVSQ